MYPFVKLLMATAAAVFGPLASTAADGAPVVSAATVAPAAASSAAASRTPPPVSQTPVSAADMERLREGLRAARARDRERAAAHLDQIQDPTAKRVLGWAVVDIFGAQMSYFELDQARRDYWGWPRAGWRQESAERALEATGGDPLRVIAWFDGAPPQTVEGALALAGALDAAGRRHEAQTLIRTWWRDRLFDLPAQERILARYGHWLSQNDHEKRLDTLLLGPQGPATQGIMALVDEDHRRLAQARIALRAEAANAEERFRAVPARLALDPGLAFERSRYLRRRSNEYQAFHLVERWPAEPQHQDGQDRMWTERRLFMLSALRARDHKTAYAAMAGHGHAQGERRAEAEFFAGWIALTRMNDPARAAKHFEALQGAGTSPITQARAGYWRGRAAEALNRGDEAQAFYQAGGRYITTFYGQLAAEKAGVRAISLGADPQPAPEDRSRFESRELVRAARILSDAGERDLFRLFVMEAADSVANAEEGALLVDLARPGDQDLAMRTVRRLASRGFILPERGYPILAQPPVSTTAEHAFVLAITRQESGFDPRVRSSADARGMMQLLPSTARIVARRMGVSYSEAQLWDADYNMRLGAYHLGELIDQFGGSMIMAAAGYNAGPGRPPQWAADCGDPRAGSNDPLDFIECVPFTETRNYIMRVMENTQVYRARLNGGTAELRPMSDLRRGGYVPPTTSGR